MKKIALLFIMYFGFGAHAATNNSDTRSSTQAYRFRSTHPCPANGSLHAACPGYVIDHVKALECGGLDLPSNMQWQTVAAAKAKDKLERLCRVKGTKRAG